MAYLINNDSPDRRGWMAGILAALLACALTPEAQGQFDPYPLPKSEVRTLPTASNGRDYVLYISFPLSYETAGPSRRYPVIYSCDGFWDFPVVAHTADYVRRDGMAPETIVVGLGYGGENPNVGHLRQWDLTPGIDPVYDASGATTGHAEEFLTVLATEIIPFVEENYRADPSFRMLFGASFGGLFAVYAALERPGLFEGIAVNGASLDWRDDLVLEMARAHKASGRSLNTRFYIGWGSGDEPAGIESSRRFVQEVSEMEIPNLRIVGREIAGAAHNGSKPENIARGIRFVFAPQAWVPVVGIDPGYGDFGKFINLSTRGRVGTGDDVLIGGIVVHGLHAKRVLVRAAGPSLTRLGVADALADPRLRIVDSDGETVASNDDWGTNSELSTLTQAFQQTGAFAFGEGSRDAALVARLEPGAYTIVVESGDGTSGVALVEAYETRP